MTTIDPREAAHFGTMAAEWWDPRGSSAMLHKLNPPRLAYLRERIDAHWGSDPASFTPLAGRTALDMGCGAGLASEPLARLGAQVTAVDAAAPAIDAARAHAAAGGLDIDYRTGGIEAVAGQTFDLVVSFEVVEHVADVPAFLAGLAGLLAPGGLLLMSTPNRTPLSRLAIVGIGETLGGIPRGTHDWDRFITPDELTAMLATAGPTVVDRRGLAFSPARGFALSDDLSLDYFLAAVSG